MNFSPLILIEKCYKITNILQNNPLFLKENPPKVGFFTDNFTDINEEITKIPSDSLSLMVREEKLLHWNFHWQQSQKRHFTFYFAGCETDTNIYWCPEKNHTCKKSYHVDNFSVWNFSVTSHGKNSYPIKYKFNSWFALKRYQIYWNKL